MAIKKCICQSTYQDKKYGKGNRVFNHLSKKNVYDWRCTVCKREV